MVESILLVLGAVIVVLAWNRLGKAMDWVGDRVGETTDMLSDITVSGAKQTARGVIISHDSLMDTAIDSKEKEVNRLKRETKFIEKLKEDEQAAYNKHGDYLSKFIDR